MSNASIRLHTFLTALCGIGPEDDFRALCADALSYHADVDELENRVKRLTVTSLEQNDEWATKCGIYEQALREIAEPPSPNRYSVVIAREALAAAEETK